MGRWLSIWLVLAACDCDGDRAVPFGQDAGTQATGGDSPTPAFRSQVGQTLPDGTREVEVEGAPLGWEGRLLRALLTVDADDDGDRDTLVLVSDEREIGVIAAKREENAFEVRSLGRFPIDEGCVASGGEVRTLSETMALVRGDIRCDSARGSVRWLLEISQTPRLRETIAVHPDPLDVNVEIDVRDLDDDDHEDVRALVTIQDSGIDPLEVELKWHDRPGGLARERDEPLATLEQVVANGRRDAADDPAAAILQAQRLELLYRTFCRHDESILQLGTSRGVLRCPPWQSTIAAIRAAAQIRQRKLAEGLAEVTDQSLSSEDRRLIEAALETAAQPDRVQRDVYEWRQTPDATITHTTLVFRDNETLAVRDVPPVRVDLSSRVSPDDGPAPISDPSGRLVVSRLRLTCSGVVVDLVGSDRLGPSLQFESPVGSPTVDAQEMPDCDRPPAGVTPWRVLGWAPQGLLVAQPGERRIVPLTADAQPAGEPEVLAASAPPPAPLRGARITANGDVWIYETPFGVLRFEGDEVELWRPTGWSQIEEPPSAAAISPDGTRIAVMRGKRVFLLEPAPPEEEEPRLPRPEPTNMGAPSPMAAATEATPGEPPPSTPAPSEPAIAPEAAAQPAETTGQ